MPRRLQPSTAPSTEEKTPRDGRTLYVAHQEPDDDHPGRSAFPTRVDLVAAERARGEDAEDDAYVDLRRTR
jgi:hypothetical protein